MKTFSTARKTHYINLYFVFCYSSLDVYKFNVRFGNNKQQNSQESMKTKKQPVR